MGCAVETNDDSDLIEGLLLGISSNDLHRIIDVLDTREKCGYIRKVTEAFDPVSGEPFGVVFIYCAACSHDVGMSVFIRPRNGKDNTQDELEDMAKVIQSAEGPSGSNMEYLTRLHETLVFWGIVDTHIDILFKLCS